MVNNTRAFRYSKIEYLKEGRKLKPSFFEYVNRHFSEGNNTRGSTYSTSWVREEKNYDDDDDGTVWHRLSHLNTRHEPSNEQYINHRHRSYFCINCYLLFWLFHTYFARSVYRYPADWSMTGPQKLKQAKLGQLSIFLIQNRTIVCLNQPYNWFVPLYCTDVSSDSLKKERLCLKILLGQAWFELYCTVIFFC